MDKNPNIKIQMNNFTLNLQTLLSRDDEKQLATTQRKNNRTERSKINFQSVSPMKVKKKTKEKQGKGLKVKQGKKVNLQLGKQADMIKKSQKVKKQTQNRSKSQKKVNNNERLSKSKHKVNKLSRHFTEYDHVIESARMRTSPVQNYRFSSQSLSKQASRSRSKSYNNNNRTSSKKASTTFIKQFNKSKSIFSSSNTEHLATQRSTQKLQRSSQKPQIKKKQSSTKIHPQRQRQKSRQKPSRSQQRKSVENFKSHGLTNKSRQKVYTQMSARYPLDDRQLNEDDGFMSHKKGGKMMESGLMSSGEVVMRPKLATNKINGNENRHKGEKEENGRRQGDKKEKGHKVKSKKSQQAISSSSNILQKQKKITHTAISTKTQPKPQSKKPKLPTNPSRTSQTNFLISTISQKKPPQKKKLTEADLQQFLTERRLSGKKRSKRTKTEADVGCGEEERERFLQGKGKRCYDEGRSGCKEDVREKAFKKKGKVFGGDNDNCAKNDQGKGIKLKYNPYQQQIQLPLPKHPHTYHKNPSKNPPKTLFIQTEFSQAPNIHFFDDISKVVKKQQQNNPLSARNQHSSRHSISCSEMSIKDEIMQSSRLKSIRLSGEGDKEEEKIEVSRIQCNEEFEYILNNNVRLLHNDNLQKNEQANNSAIKQSDIRKISVLQLQDSDQQQQSQQQSQQHSIDQHHQSLHFNRNSLQHHHHHNQEISFHRKLQGNFAGEGQRQRNEQDEERKELGELCELNQVLGRMIGGKGSGDRWVGQVKCRSATQLQDRCKFQYNISDNDHRYLNSSINPCQPSPLLPTQPPPFHSSTLLTFPRSPPLSPGSYANQNPQKILSTLTKRRKSIQQQQQIAKSFSNKRLLQELELLQTLQKLQKSVECSLMGDCYEDRVKEEGGGGKGCVLEMENQLLLQDKSCAGVGGDNEHNQLATCLRQQHKQDSPLLSQHSSKHTNRPLSHQPNPIKPQQQPTTQPLQINPFITSQPQPPDQHQPIYQPKTSQVPLTQQHDLSQLSLYEESNVMMKKQQYSQLSMEFEKEMEDYLRGEGEVGVGVNRGNDGGRVAKESNKVKKDEVEEADEIFYLDKRREGNERNAKLLDKNQQALQQLGQKQQQQQVKQISLFGDSDKPQPHPNPPPPQPHPTHLIHHQLCTHIQSHLLTQFTLFLNTTPHILHKFLYYISTNDLITFNQAQQAELQTQLTLHPKNKQVNENQFLQYLQSRIHAGNQYVVGLAREVFGFVQGSQEHRVGFLHNINQSFGLKPLKTLKWMRRAFADNDQGKSQREAFAEGDNDQDEDDGQGMSELSQTQQLQAVLSPTLLADFDSTQSQLIFQQINQQQYYLNHAVYAALNQICDSLRPYGQNGPPVLPKSTPHPTTSLLHIQPRILQRLTQLLSLRMGRMTFTPEQQPQKIITQSYRRMDLMMVAQEHQKWSQRNLQDMVFESQYYLALHVVEMVVNEEVMEVWRVLEG